MKRVISIEIEQVKLLKSLISKATDYATRTLQEEALDEALSIIDKALSEKQTALSRESAYREASPDDIRAEGWTVAVHNDYKLNGVQHTFWLFTKGDKALKGEGMTDAEALNHVRAALDLKPEEPVGREITRDELAETLIDVGLFGFRTTAEYAADALLTTFRVERR